MQAEISYDLVMDEEMDFVEGTYRLPDGDWQVFIFTKFDEVTAVRWTSTTWESGATGVSVRYPRDRVLNKATAEAVLSEALGVTAWREVRGPDSIETR